MSKREQNLLTLLILVAIAAGGILLYRNFYTPRYQQAEQRLNLSNEQIEFAQTTLESSDLYIQEQEWLSSHEPKENSQQATQATLQATCERLSKSSQLEIKTQNPLASIQPESAFYHRARMDLLLSGKEVNLYKLLVSLDDPTQFRKVTYLRMSPLRTDNTLIEAKLIVEQWFKPSSK